MRQRPYAPMGGDGGGIIRRNEAEKRGEREEVDREGGKKEDPETE